MSNTVTLTINEKEIEVERGTSILQAAQQMGVEVPHFCYHDKLSVPANCRMCLVEVEGGPPKPVASCAMACGEGMVVKTDSDMVKKARKGVMEMLLINHPLDCPICDQGGECDLQDQAVAYGMDRSRFYENKRAKEDPELGPLVKTVMTRCINCTRCVRFADEVAGTPVLGQFHRGEDAEIGTFIDQIVKTELSGNMIDICPVGALTSKPYAFKARSWELKKTNSVDVMDAVGSNIRVDSRGREVMRILPRLNESINEEWISDRTRFAYDGLNYQRLDRPYIRDGKKLREASWEEAFNYTAERLKPLKRGEIAALAGDLADVESMVALKDLMTSLRTGHMDCRTDGADYDVSERSAYLFNSGIEAIEQADAILIIGANPRHEATMINARIRKARLESRVPVAMIGENVDLGYKVEHLGKGPEDILALVKSKTGFAQVMREAERPMIIIGSGVFARSDAKTIQHLTRRMAEDFGVVNAETGWNGYNVMQRAASRVGGLDIGFVPQDSDDYGFAKIVKASQDGKVKAVYLLGADEFDAKAELGKKTFVIYQGSHGDKGAERADVIFPGCAYTEKDGLYVNTEGRVQMGKKAVTPPGDAKEDWKILRALSEACGKPLPYNNHFQLLERIAREWSHMGELDVLSAAEWGAFGAEGKLLKRAFENPISGYYLTNAICRASVTMNKCTEAFVAQQPKPPAPKKKVTTVKKVTAKKTPAKKAPVKKKPTKKKAA